MAGGCGFQLSARPKPPWTCLLSRSMGTSPQDAELPYAPGETAKLGLAEWYVQDSTAQYSAVQGRMMLQGLADGFVRCMSLQYKTCDNRARVAPPSVSVGLFQE